MTQLEELALEGRRLLREQPDDHFARLLEAVAALTRRAKIDPVGPRFLLVPPGPDAELEPAPRRRCQGGRHVGQDGRVAIVDAGNQGSEARRSSPGRVPSGWSSPPGKGRCCRKRSDRSDRRSSLTRTARYRQPLPHGEHVGPGRILRRGLEGEAHRPRTLADYDRRFPADPFSFTSSPARQRSDS